MTYSVLLSCSCVTDIPSAWSWHSDGSCLIPKHPSGFSQGSRTFLGDFPPLLQSKALGCISPRAQQPLVMMPDPKQAAIPNSLFMGELGHPLPGHPVAGLVQIQEQKVGKEPSPGTELCWRWYPKETGINTWILELQCVFYQQRGFRGRAQSHTAEHNLTLQGFSQTPSGFRCRFCWRKQRCLIRDLLPGGFFAFSLGAPGGPSALICSSNF